MEKICFTGGGTAGHISPNLALIPYFLEQGYEVHYIGSKTGIENQMVNGKCENHKFLKDGHLYILREGKMYNVLGMEK